MKLLVYGAGAIGAYIGVNLIRAGNEVTFVGREAFVDAVRRDGLRVKLPQGGEWHMTPVHAYTVLHDAMQRGTFEASILTVKAHSVDQALSEFERFQSALGQLVCFQNGVGTEQRIAAKFGEHRVIAATLTSPVSVLGPGRYALDRLGGGVGYSALGQNQPFARKLVQASFTDLMPATLYDDARALKWSKMLLNIVGNASAAIFGKPVAEIYRDPACFALEMRMVRECLAVMRALGIPLIDPPGYKARAFARVATTLPAWLARPLLAGRVGSGRGGKLPSFFDDAAHVTGRSEVGYLNGQIVDHGARLGVPTPVNGWLTQTLLAVVTGRRKQGDPSFADEIARL